MKLKIENRKSKISRARGISLVETLISLAITSLLLAATMVATNASFRAYADACEQASSQASTRMITNRLITLVRTSTAHGPLQPDVTASPPITLSGNAISSNYIEMLDPNGNDVKIEYRSATQELWMTLTPAGGGAATSQSLMGGVTAAAFTLIRKQDDSGLWELDRGTMDLTVTPGADATLYLENGHTTPIRIIASSMPRKLD